MITSIFFLIWNQHNLLKQLKLILINTLSDKKENRIYNFLRKLKRFLENYDNNSENMQINYLDQLNNIEHLSLFGLKKKKLSHNLFQGGQHLLGLNKILFRDFRFSLLGDMLVKLDRHSMANSIELRMPFLDKKLVSFSLSLSTRISCKSNQPKYLLKKVLEKYFLLIFLHYPAPKL